MDRSNFLRTSVIRFSTMDSGDGKLKRAWSYVINTDRGSAPNYDGPAVTLAICKPRIRRGAKLGDLVVGFNGVALSSRPNSLRWAGQVGEVMTLEDYWEDSRFNLKRPGTSKTPDNIYRLSRGIIHQVPNSSHDCCNIETDLNGRNTLIFSKAWHFGEEGPDPPEYFGLHVPMNARRTEPLRQIPQSIRAPLLAWLDHHDLGLPALSAKPAPTRSLPRVTPRRPNASTGPGC